MMHKSLKFLSKIFWVPHPFTTLSFSKWSGIFLRRKMKIFYDGQLTTIEDNAVNLMYKKKLNKYIKNTQRKLLKRKLFMSMVDDFARVTPLGAVTAVGLGAVSAVGLVFALFLG